MTFNSPPDSLSIFKNGKLKPGIYKIQNIFTETYVDIEVHSRGVCCRPAKDLEEGRGLWEIKNLGVGYTVQVVEPGKPDQFCTLIEGVTNSPLEVAAYPVAWRVEVVNDDKHRGFEYVRLSWGATNYAWAVHSGSKDNGAKVVTWVGNGPSLEPWRMWKLVPVKVEGFFTPPQSPLGSGSPPSYGENTTGQSSTHTQHAESERDDFGTIVTEVTTTVVTTRKKYRVEDA